MMKKVSFVCISLLSIGLFQITNFAFAEPIEVTIGTGTGTWNYPLSTYYHDARTQTIYLAGEIGGFGTIYSLSLYVSTAPGQTMNNFTIRLKHTDLSVYGSSPQWESSGWTTVYQASQAISTTGWKTFTFSTPFIYNGTQNLMVDISFNNSSFTSDGYCRCSIPGGNRSICYRTDSGYGDPLTWSASIPTPSATANVPNLKLAVDLNTVAIPAFTPDGGAYTSDQTVTITCATSEATIRYTTDGSDPDESDTVIASGASLTISQSLTLKARAWKEGYDPSGIKTAQYQLVVATPVFEPDGGSFTSDPNVLITCATDGATIHYTTNGADPTESDPTIASGGTVSVSVNPPTTLKARAWKAGFDPSLVKESVYRFGYISNPSMEDNFISGVAESWSSYGSGLFSQGTLVHEGIKSQSITFNGNGWGSFGPAGIYQILTNLQSGALYSLSGWLSCQKDCYGMMNYGELYYRIGVDKSGGINPDSPDIIWRDYYAGAWTDWTEMELLFSAPDSPVTVFLYLSGSQDCMDELYDPEYGPMPIPLDWTFTCYIDDMSIDPIIISQNAQVEASTPVWADGIQTSEISIQALDANGNPISNIPPQEISVLSTGSNNESIPPISSTDTNGKTKAWLASTTAEIKTVSATIFGVPQLQTSDVDFLRGGKWIKSGKKVASDGTAGDEFGYRVAISGSTAVVGVPYDDDKGTNSGSVYVFSFDGTQWIQQSKLVASDGTAYDYFGYSVALDGSTAIVGSYYDDDKGADSGSVYVFSFDGTQWIQQAKLVASDGTAHDYFGYSVALDGSTAIVGSYYDDDKGTNSGSVYIFNFDGTQWTQQTKLIASDGAANDYFGCSVALDGITALVGAYYDDDKGTNSGSVYVFNFDGTQWTQQVKLVASDGAAYDCFGYPVALDGSTAIVGANCDDDKGANSGSAYLFSFDGTQWVQDAKLIASDGAVSDCFGFSIALDGSRAIVGSRCDDDKGTDSGSIYLFNRYRLPEDFTLDDEVKYDDFSLLSGQWFQTGCIVPDWCQGADLDKDGQVGLSDLLQFADGWLIDWPALPPNDECSNAYLVELYEIYTGSTERKSGKDVWFKFIAPESRTYDFSLCGSGYDTTITLYDGCGGSQKAYNNDACGTQSKVSLLMSAGQMVWIRVGGNNEQFGQFQLAVTPLDNDECVNAYPAAVGSVYTGTTVGKTDSDVWYTFTPTLTGYYQISLCGSDFDTMLSVYNSCGGTLLASNDNACGQQSELVMLINNANVCKIRISGSSGQAGNYQLLITRLDNDDCAYPYLAALNQTYTGSTVGMSDNDVWYQFTPSSAGDYVFSLCGSDYDTMLSVYDNCGGTVLASNDNACGLQSKLMLNLSASQTYRIQIAGSSGLTGNYQFVVRKYGDECDEAIIAQSDQTYSEYIDNWNNYDVWYQFTAPETNTYNFSLCDSEFDTVIAIYDSCGGTLLAYDDNSCGSYQSYASLPMLANQTVRISIGAGYYYWWSGYYNFYISSQGSNPQAPVNDLCQNAQSLYLYQELEGTTLNASGLFSLCSSEDIYDVWYIFEPPSAGFYFIYMYDDAGMLQGSLSTWMEGCNGISTDCQVIDSGYAEIPTYLSSTVLIRVASSLATQGHFYIGVYQ